MAEILVSAQSRADRGKNAARRLRAKGMIPAVVYGGKGDALAVSVDPKTLLRVLRSESGRNTILKLDLGDRRQDLGDPEELAGRSGQGKLPSCGFLPHRHGRRDPRHGSHPGKR